MALVFQPIKSEASIPPPPPRRLAIPPIKQVVPPSSPPRHRGLSFPADQGRGGQRGVGILADQVSGTAALPGPPWDRLSSRSSPYRRRPHRPAVGSAFQPIKSAGARHRGTASPTHRPQRSPPVGRVGTPWQYWPPPRAAATAATVLRQHRSMGQAARLRPPFRRFLNYHALPGNMPALVMFRRECVRRRLAALRRRGQRQRMNWKRFRR